MSASLPAPSPAELALMTDEQFTARWRELVGEPPAILLQDRVQMTRLLVESMALLRSPPKLNVGSAPIRPSGQAVR